MGRAIELPSRWQDWVLSTAAFMLLPILVVAPRGATLVVCCAGVAAASLLWQTGSVAPFSWRRPSVVALAALLVLAAGSAAWSITPLRSLEMAGRITGVSVAGLSLIRAAPLAANRSIVLALVGGAIAAIGLAFVELASGEALGSLFYMRGLFPARMNEAATAMAILALPIAAMPGGALPRSMAMALGLASGLAVALLAGTTAKLALAIAIAAAAIFLLDYRRAGRIAAVVAAAMILAAPLVFPPLVNSTALFATADEIKSSASHRLLIWSFVGERIAERPLLGWGMDTSRAIPNGRELARPAQEKLPLHPHNAALQLWLELGFPGALLGAVLAASRLRALATRDWSPRYAAAVGGALVAGLVALLNSFSLWNESWQATLWFLAFLVLIMARPVADAAGNRRPAGVDGAVPVCI